MVFYFLQRMKVLQHSASEADTDHFFNLVENWFLTCIDGDVVSLTRATFPGDDVLFRRAQAILRDHSLRDWVFSMNITKGLAPASRDVALKWNELVQRDMEDARNISDWERDDLSRPSNRRYFRQWRQRMGIHIGKIQTRQYMSRLEISDKVLVP